MAWTPKALSLHKKKLTIIKLEDGCYVLIITYIMQNGFFTTQNHTDKYRWMQEKRGWKWQITFITVNAVFGKIKCITSSTISYFMNLWIPPCDMNMISEARFFRTVPIGEPLSPIKAMKKGMKENGVIDRILHCNAPKISASILRTVCVSNIMPPSLWFKRA